VKQLLGVPEAIGGVRMLVRDVRRLLVDLALCRISALFENAQDHALGGACGIRRIAHEAAFSLSPLLEVPLACHDRKRSELELSMLLLDVREDSLRLTSPARRDRALVGRAESLLEPLPPSRATHCCRDEGDEENCAGARCCTDCDPFPGVHGTTS
jgi:hypothetical protein